MSLIETPIGQLGDTKASAAPEHIESSNVNFVPEDTGTKKSVQDKRDAKNEAKNEMIVDSQQPMIPKTCKAGLVVSWI